MGNSGRVVVVSAAMCAVMACHTTERKESDDLPVPPRPDAGCSQELLDAVQRLDIQSIQGLRRRGAIAKCQATAEMLERAVHMDDLAQVAALMAAGLDVTSVRVIGGPCRSLWQRVLYDRNMSLPPNTLPQKETWAFIELLLRVGADANAPLPPEHRNGDYQCLPPPPWPDVSGMTPLMAAALIGDDEAALLLLHAGARVEAQDSGGHTALDYAAVGARPGKRAAVSELLTGGWRSKFLQ
jgi:Ankyrin repeat